MYKNKVKIGDSVRLLNRMEGIIKTIDKDKCKFTLCGEYEFMSFIIADILVLNGEDVKYNMNLTF